MVKSEMLCVQMRNEFECPNTTVEFSARLQSISGDMVLILPVECITFDSDTSQEGDMAKVYDLEARTLRLSKAVSSYVHRLPITVTNTETSKQLADEANQLMRIFGAIITKCESGRPKMTES